MAGEISKPHDHLFRSVFGEDKEAEAASLLQACLPPAVSRELLWSSLKWQSASFIDDRLRDSESDLLYAIRRTADGAAAWLEKVYGEDAWERIAAARSSALMLCNAGVIYPVGLPGALQWLHPVTEWRPGRKHGKRGKKRETGR